MLENIGLITLQLITGAVMLFGLFSLLFVILPGLVVIWVAALIYGIITGFNWISITLLLFITILMIIGGVIDNILIGAGAYTKGAGWISIAVALVAGIAGSILWPPLGGLLTALVGLFLIEFLRIRNLRHAWDSTRGMLLGCSWAVVIRFAFGAMMILWWLLWIGIGWYETHFAI